MEGRTIARPDSTSGQHHATRSSPSMEGRTIARPDLMVVVAAERLGQPSMEGRTIARPDPASVRRLVVRPHAFNGGPDNCPARHRLHTLTVGRPKPSMEGRTIARPDWHFGWVIEGGTILQWRAGQLPGQT